jgi:hypothetical protein
MSVTEIKQALGEWSLRLRRDTPKSVMDALTLFGHLAIVPGSVNPSTFGDNMLKSARYVGVYRGRNASEDFELRGVGMSFWLGDEDDKGDVFETAVTFTAASFATTIAGLLPPHGSITAGVIGAIGGTYTGSHQWQTPRAALTYVTDLYSSPSAPVEWRVNYDGTLDADLVSNLYVIDPRAVLVRRGSGRDLKRVALPGAMSLDKKGDDITTRVVLLAEGEGPAISTGAADAGVNPYKDIHGNAARFTRLSSESDTTAANATARAQLLLNRFLNPDSAVELSASVYDIKGDLVVGDYIYVYDPIAGFEDPAQEVYWGGERLNPALIRCVEMTWPVVGGWTVAFRDSAGVWTDLSMWYEPESGDTSIKVGELPSALTGSGGSMDFRPNIGGPDLTVPAAPTFNTPFSSVAYESSALNDVRAAVFLTWNQPLNVDASTIQDGDHYEIRYRVNQTYTYPTLWSAAMANHWNQLQRWGRLLDNPAAIANDWIYINVPWDTNQFTIFELLVAAQYEFQIRAVDAANPPNAGAWTASVLYTTQNDTIAPSQPAPPTVAASRIAVQIVHTLGLASGGTYNLPFDLHHLEVHAAGGDFFPTVGTKIGILVANEGNLRGQIPVTGTLPIEYTEQINVKVIAVDRFGNKSSPSVAVTATANLIDSAHISDLTASKITAGIITADLLLSGSIKTAMVGQRAELNSDGLQLYNADGDLTLNLTADLTQPNFIAILDPNGDTVSSMDALGNISGVILTASDDILLDGDSLGDRINNLGQGIVAYGRWTTATSPAGTETGIFEISFVADSTRLYRISIASRTTSSVTTDSVVIRLRDGGDSLPSVSSPSILSGSRSGVVGTALSVDSATFTDGLHRLILTYGRSSGSGNVNVLATPDTPCIAIIEDIGPATVDNTAVANDGGISGSDVTPVTTYTKTYKATWSGTYDGGSDLVTYYNNEAHQGYYDSSVGNRRSLVGFNSTQIKGDLAGATIKSIKLTAYAMHWYNNSGGTAVIGTHTYTSRPSSWSSSRVNDNRQQSASWPKPGKRTVTLSASFGTDFKSGAATGIAFGPGPSTSHTYYGKFSGYDAGSNAPTLTITYTK